MNFLLYFKSTLKITLKPKDGLNLFNFELVRFIKSN